MPLGRSRWKWRTLLKPGGCMIDIHPSPTKMARSVFSRNFEVLIGVWKTKDLEKLAQAAAGDRRPHRTRRKTHTQGRQASNHHALAVLLGAPCGARLLDLAWTAWRAGIIPE
jgi:hypothetical protein